MDVEPQIKPPSSAGRRSRSRDTTGPPEVSWDFRKEALKKAFHILESTEEHLAQTEHDSGYQQYLANLGKTYKSWETVPEQYRNYLNDLIRYIAIENPPYDPWIRAWVEDRAESRDVEQLSDLTWNPWWDFGKVSAGRGVQTQKAEQASNDFFSFGKRASVMEFTFQSDTETSPMGAQFPKRTRPTVTQVTREAVFIRPPSNGLRWIHLPSNNMLWVETLVKAIYENDPEITAKEAYDPTILGHRFWRGRQDASSVETRFGHRHYARFMRPTCLKARIGPEKKNPEDGRTDMVLFMPFIHWETDIARLQQHYVMSDVDKQVKSNKVLPDIEISTLPCSIDEKLLRKYLRHRPPLHVRRTLDQSYHYTLDDTKIRDRDQVVLRYARKKISQGDESIRPRVLMVDQCWLWVIGNIVITCLPDVWNEEDDVPEEDSPNVVERITRRVQENYWRIRSPFDLTTIIVESCTASATDSSDSDLEIERDFENFHYLDWFYLSIREVMVAQTELFEQFITHSERMEEVAEQMDLTEPNTAEYKLWKAEFEGLQRRLPRGLFDITEEIRKLREIKDIQDELQMIEDVLIQQTTAIHKLEDALGYYDVPVAKALSNVNSGRDVIHQFQRDARQAYEELTVLLDLKQKQANISEARSSRLQAEQANEQANETARQGTIIMLFTIVTILFLPLSTISSIFGVNAKELNGGNLSIGIVFAYLFSISLVIVLFACLLAFHKNARLFSTLLLKIILEYADRLSGFSHLFGESRIERMKKNLLVLKEKKQDRLLKEDDSGTSEDTEEKAPFRENITRLFMWRSKSSSSTEV